MIQGTIAEIEKKIQKADALDNSSRKELLSLVSALKTEVTDLSATHREQAESIAGFAALSAHEATRDTKDPRLLTLALDGLSSSVKGFEVTHPRLVQAVNSICDTLSNMGI
jgi:hypothetical protein